MKTKENSKYALIRDDMVVTIFIKTNLSKWDENDILAIEIPKELEDRIEPYSTKYINDIFVFKDKFKPLDIENLDNNLFAAVKDSIVEMTFDKKEYNQQIANNLEAYKEYQIIPIPNDIELGIQIGTQYKNGFIELDLEKLKNIYLVYSKQCYENISNNITLNINVTEMLSWSLQEAEAKAYVASKDSTLAPFIAQIAKTRNVDLDVLAQKIIDKSNLYRQGLSQLLGYKQKIDSQI